jgi:eukaryotic-like serine/threonine-protein kinase
MLEMDRKRLSEAEQHLREALVIYRKTLPPTHPYIASTLYMLGRTLLDRNEPEDAEAPLQESIEIWAAQTGIASSEYALVQSALGRAWALLGKTAVAEQAFKQSYAVLRRSQGAQGEATLRTQHWMQELYAREKRSDEIAAYLATFKEQ